MTDAQIVKIMSLVEDFAAAKCDYSHDCAGVQELVILDEARAAVEAALRDAPQAEPGDTYIQNVPDKCDRIVWRGNYYHLPLATTPSAPTAVEPTPEQSSVVEPDERTLSHELIKVAAWLLSPEPTRQIDRLEDQTHIGHRQFENAQEAMRETLRNKAFEIRNFVDGARALKGTP